MTRQRYMITGLCMQGNKGGPAIAISLTDAIRRKQPGAEFVFSVPGGKSYIHEQRWADRYGFEIVENIDLRHLVPPWCLRGPRLRRTRAWARALRSSTAMIQMSAISYVGPPAATPGLPKILSKRFMDFALAGLLRVPMLAWTQSYGPLSTRLIRFLAWLDLRNQPVIFCRGDDCLADVSRLLPRKPVRSFPDIAVTLAFDKSWGQDFLAARGLRGGDYVTLSPSAVIYAKTNQAGTENLHLQCLHNVCNYLIERNFNIVVLPHTLRPEQNSPDICDYQTSLKLMELLPDSKKIILIDDDLSPVEIKSVIANARFHVGGRYHSVVAALSSGIPAISLSWHPKYKDLMRSYDSEAYIIGETETNPTTVISKLLDEYDLVADRVTSSHAEVLRQSEINVAEFCDLLGRVR